MKSSLAIVLVLAALLPMSLSAQVAPPATTLPVDPAVSVGRLGNGLSWYVRRNTRPAGRAELRLVVNAGSALETETQRGLAHLVEHMAFNGTERYRKMEIVSYLESIGMRFGPEINAYTGFDETVYMIEVPTDNAAMLEKAFDILYEWSTKVAFEADEIRKERGVVVEEWRLGRGADGRIQDAQLPVLLSGSRYADRLPIGLKEVIEGAPDTQITSFYKDWYRPDLMAVIAVGDFDPVAVTRLLERTFGRIPAATGAKPRPHYPVPDHPGTLYSVVSDPEATYSAVTVAVKREVDPFATVGDYRRKIVGSLVGIMLNQRLAELTQAARPPFLQAWAGADRLVRTKEVFNAGALVEAGGMERGLEALLTEIERVRVHGFTAGELGRAKSDLLAGMERAWRERETTVSRSFAEEYIRAYLTREPIPGITYEYDLHVGLLPLIDLAEVNTLGATLLSEDNRVVLAQGPASSPPPGQAALASVFERVRATATEAWVDAASDAPLVSEPPRRGTVVQESRMEALGAVSWTLSNGARVIVKPTDYRTDQVVLQAFSPGGSSLVSEGDHIAAITATSVVQAGGLGEHSAQTLAKLLAGKTARVTPWIGETTEGLSGSSAPADLETLLELAYLSFTQPRRDPVAFQSLQGRLRAYVADRAASPEAVFSDTLTAIMTRNSARTRPLTSEALGTMDLDASFRVYRERFASAGDFTFLLVGNLDLASLRPLVETWIGGLPTTGVRESWKDLGIDPPALTIVTEVRKGLEPRSQVALRFSGPFAWSRDEVIRLTAVADILEIRLREVLREALSGTYGASVGVSAQKYPDGEYTLAIDFGCDPVRVEELTAAVFKEIEWIRTAAIPAQYLTTEKETLRRSREVSLRENSFWTASIQSSLLNGEDPAEVLKFDARVAALNASVLRRAAQTYLTPDRYVRVVLYPEAKTP